MIRFTRKHLSVGFVGYVQTPWEFEEAVRRLRRIGTDIAKGHDKVTVQIPGKFNGVPFQLYDYKGDRTLHVGGPSTLDVAGLQAELVERMQAAGSDGSVRHESLIRQARIVARECRDGQFESAVQTLMLTDQASALFVLATAIEALDLEDVGILRDYLAKGAGAA